MASDQVQDNVQEAAGAPRNAAKDRVAAAAIALGTKPSMEIMQQQLEHLQLDKLSSNASAAEEITKLPSPSSTTESSSIRSPGEVNGEPPGTEDESIAAYRGEGGLVAVDDSSNHGDDVGNHGHDARAHDDSVPSVFHNIFINNLAPHVTADELRDVFEVYGQITSVVVMKDEVGNSRGFGFVNFLHADDAALAVEGAQGYSAHGSVWNVAPAINKRGQQTGYLSTHYSQAGIVSEDKMNRNLYIRNLCREVDEAMLLAAFSEYGNVESVRVLRDNYGNSRSVGFVQYHGLEDAMAALKGMNGRQMGTKTIYVQVARHHLDEAKKAAAAADSTPQHPDTPHMLPGVTPVIPPMIPPRTMSMPAPPPGLPPPAASPMAMYPAAPYPPAMMMGASHNPAQPLMYVSAPGWQPMPPAVLPKANVAAVRDALEGIDPEEPPERRNTILGEALFPLVQQLTMDQAAVPKITGMLLELKDDDVLKLLGEPDYLQLKVWAAQRTLYGTSSGGGVVGPMPPTQQPLLPAAHLPLAMYGRAVSADGGARMGAAWYGSGMPRSASLTPIPPPPPATSSGGGLHRTNSNPINSMVASVMPAYRTASYGAPGAYVAAPPAAYGMMAPPPMPMMGGGAAVMGGGAAGAMYRAGANGVPAMMGGYATPPAHGGMYRTHSSSSGSGKRRGGRGSGNGGNSGHGGVAAT